MLKKFSDACAEYADAIHNEATLDMSKELDSGIVISVAADEEIILRFKELGVAQENVDEFNEARILRNEAKDLFKQDRNLAITKYLLSAELSREAACSIDQKNITPTKTGNYLLFYYFKMNEAICLLSTNISEHIKSAFNIYNKLTTIYLDFPLLGMRLAQSYGKLGYVDESILHFSKTKEQIIEFEKFGCIFDDNLPETDYAHVKKYLSKLYGFQLWHKAHYMKIENNVDLQEKISLLKQAYEITSTGLVEIDKNQKISVVNNLLYYAIELENLGNQDFQRIGSTVKQHLETFEKLIVVLDTDDLLFMDTLSKAYCHLGMHGKAIEVLNKIIDIALNRSTNDFYDQSDILELAQEASLLKKNIEEEQS